MKLLTNVRNVKTNLWEVCEPFAPEVFLSTVDRSSMKQNIVGISGEEESRENKTSYNKTWSMECSIDQWSCLVSTWLNKYSLISYFKTYSFYSKKTKTHLKYFIDFLFFITRSAFRFMISAYTSNTVSTEHQHDTNL